MVRPNSSQRHRQRSRRKNARKSRRKLKSKRWSQPYTAIFYWGSRDGSGAVQSHHGVKAAKATAIKEDAEKDLNEALHRARSISRSGVPCSPRSTPEQLLKCPRPALNVAEKALKALKLSSLQECRLPLLKEELLLSKSQPRGNQSFGQASRWCATDLGGDHLPGLPFTPLRRPVGVSEESKSVTHAR